MYHLPKCWIIHVSEYESFGDPTYHIKQKKVERNPTAQTWTPSCYIMPCFSSSQLFWPLSAPSTVKPTAIPGTSPVKMLWLKTKPFSHIPFSDQWLSLKHSDSFQIVGCTKNPVNQTAARLGQHTPSHDRRLWPPHRNSWVHTAAHSHESMKRHGLTALETETKCLASSAAPRSFWGFNLVITITQKNCPESNWLVGRSFTRIQFCR